MPNPLNSRRQELAQLDARLLTAESDLRQNAAFRLHVRRSVRMHPLLAGAVAGAVFLLLLLFALSRKPSYVAESLIYVEPLEVRVLSDGSSSGYDPSRYDSYLQQQVQTVERADTLEAALDKLPPGAWSLGQMEGALKVERVMNSYQLAIDVTATDPKAAAAAANAVTSAYLEEGRTDEHTRAHQRLQLLTEERQRITDDITQEKAEQAHLGTSLGVANPNGVSGNPYDLQSEGLRSQLAAAREAHDTVAAQLASVSGTDGTGLSTAANELIATDPGLVSVKQTLSQRRAVLNDQMAGLTPTNPVYRQDQEEIAALDRSMDRATAEARERAERQLQDKLRLDLRRTADVEGRLNSQLAEQTAKATGAGPKLQRAAELETDLQRLSTRFATVDDAIRGLQLETSGPGQAHLVLAARVPETPQASRRRLILLLALPLALLCGIGAAVVARRRDGRMYLPDDLQEVLGFAPMGVLPDPGEVSAAAYDDFLLRLAGGLEGAYRHGNARSFVVTPVSVDTTAKGMLPQLSGKLQQIGFRAGYIPADQLIPRLTGPAGGVSLVSASGRKPRPRDGVAATQLERLLLDYDIILIQAPPLLGSALTEYAVRCADATLLLVESSHTDRTDLRRAAVLLERLNPQGVGAVLQTLSMRFADKAFLEAVRAADHSSMRHAERFVETASGAPAAPLLPAVPPVERVRSIDPATVTPESTAETQPMPAPVVVEEYSPELNQSDGDVAEETVAMKLLNRWKKSGGPEDQDSLPAETSTPIEPHDMLTKVAPIFFIEETELLANHDRWAPSGHGGFSPAPQAATPSALQEEEPHRVKETREDVSLSRAEWEKESYSPVAASEERPAAPVEPEEPVSYVSAPPETAVFVVQEAATHEAERPFVPRALEVIQTSSEQELWSEPADAPAAAAGQETAAPYEVRLPRLHDAEPAEKYQDWYAEALNTVEPSLAPDADTADAEEHTTLSNVEPAGTPQGWAARAQTEPLVTEAAEERYGALPVATSDEESFVLQEDQPAAAGSSERKMAMQVETVEPDYSFASADPASAFSEPDVQPTSEAFEPPSIYEEGEPAKPVSWFRRLLGLGDEPALHISPARETGQDYTRAEVLPALDMAEPEVNEVTVPTPESEHHPVSTHSEELVSAEHSRPEEPLVVQQDFAAEGKAEQLDSLEEARVAGAWAETPFMPSISVQTPSVIYGEMESAGGPTRETVSADDLALAEDRQWLRTHEMAEAAGTFAPFETETQAGEESRIEEPAQMADGSEDAIETPQAGDALNSREKPAVGRAFPAEEDFSAAAEPYAGISHAEPRSVGLKGVSAARSVEADPEPPIYDSPSKDTAKKKGFARGWSQSDDYKPDLPLVSFPRPRTPSPSAAVAGPSESTPVIRTSEAPESTRSEPIRPPQRGEMAASSVRIRESAILPQRLGLAKAVAQVAADEGPPARASEGLTAMRTGAGLRKALVRQEAIVRPQPQETLSPHPQPGMSRRWAMLSQFERAEPGNSAAEESKQRFPPVAAGTGLPDPLRKSGV